MAFSVRSALAVVALWAMLTLTAANIFEQGSMNKLLAGDATYYGYRTRGFGHCSFHFHGFGDSKGYAGTPLAINAAQYTGPSVCGLCVKYRGVGQGAGGNPVSTAWQPGFICDQCPECKFGDLDQQMGGDGRWKVEWYPVQCPVGGSSFRFGFQGGNPWYRKMMVANARVPLKSVRIWESGAWKDLVGTIDNYWEYHGDTSKAWAPCAKIQVTSILGDTVTDDVCCSSGTCTGKSQLPCRSSLPSDDCQSNQTPDKVNVGGIGQAGQSGSARSTAKESVQRSGVNARAAAAARRFGRGDLSAARVATRSSSQLLSKGQQCGGRGFGCSGFGSDACQDKKFPGVYCDAGLKCKRNDDKWWGCQ